MSKYNARHMCSIVWYMMYDRETGHLLTDEGEYTSWICYSLSHVMLIVTRTLRDDAQHGDIFCSLGIGAELV